MSFEFSTSASYASCTMQHRERIRRFVEVIWAWYAVHKRSLPWRDLPDRDLNLRAYKILVSEVMLQQTQVPRVITTYRRFLEQFPTVYDLASASNRDILIAWRGMGYNSRALRLRDAARVITQNSGEFPQSYEALLSIPGVGPYTAAAIRNFAWNIETPCIDTNIRRILHRTFHGPERPDGTWAFGDAALLNLAGNVLRSAMEEKKSLGSLPGRGRIRRTAAEWHAALMDFGSMVQTKRNPRWDCCPLTAAGLMKATPKNTPKYRIPYTKYRVPEPGRMVAGRYIPNRIFRGRIVEALRDANDGLTASTLGHSICIDFTSEHSSWLKNILQKLILEKLLERKEGKYRLFESAKSCNSSDGRIRH